MSTRAALIGAVFALVACLAAAEPVTHQPSGIIFPDEIGEFRLVDIEDYERKRPGLGVAYHYRTASGLVGTVYVYTAGFSPVPVSIAHPLMERLREQTAYEITEYARRRGESVRQVSRETRTIGTAVGDTAVMFDAFVIDAPTAMRNTYSWLWTSRGHVMKVRVTSPAFELEPNQVIAFSEFVVRLAARPAQWKKRAAVVLGQFSTQEERQAWLAYGIALISWINRNHVLETAPEGPFIPSFEAELHARQGQLQIWRELNEKTRLSLPYMDDMLKVASSGFLREYIWRYHRRPNWSETPAELRMNAFETWRAENLQGHAARTGAQVHFEFAPPK